MGSFFVLPADTQVEPTARGETNLPDELTYGLEYEGYGELYLNILREETVLG
jgi:hypothetical protein